MESPDQTSLTRRALRSTREVLLLPAGVGGAMLGLSLSQLDEANNWFAGLVVGWLYGMAVRGLMRLFGLPRSWSWLVGLFAGPVPLALLIQADAPAQDRGGVILVGALLGLLLGLLEAAHGRTTRPAIIPPEARDT